MAAPWLQQAMGPSPAPRVASMTTTPTPTLPTQDAGFDVNALLKNLQSQQDAANQAGMQRYQNLLGVTNEAQRKIMGPRQPDGSGGFFNRAGGLLSGIGETARTRIDENVARQRGQAEQDLINRGLGNTTIRQSTMRGIESDAERQRQAVDETVAQQRAGLLERRAGSMMDLARLRGDAILSRQDQGPNMGQYASLLQQMAASGGGGGSFSGGGGAGFGSAPSAGGVSTRSSPPEGGGFGSGGGGGQGSQQEGVQTFKGQGESAVAYEGGDTVLVAGSFGPQAMSRGRAEREGRKILKRST